MCAYICIFIKVYYICSIFYCLRQIIYRINTIKPRLIFKYSLFQNLLKDEAALELSFSIPSPALSVPSQALIVPFLDKYFVNRSPSKLAPNVPHNILKNPPFSPFVLFLIASVTPFNKIPECCKA